MRREWPVAPFVLPPDYPVENLLRLSVLRRRASFGKESIRRPPKGDCKYDGATRRAHRPIKHYKEELTKKKKVRVKRRLVEV